MENSSGQVITGEKWKQWSAEIATRNNVPIDKGRVNAVTEVRWRHNKDPRLTWDKWQAVAWSPIYKETNSWFSCASSGSSNHFYAVPVSDYILHLMFYSCKIIWKGNVWVYTKVSICTVLLVLELYCKFVSMLLLLPKYFQAPLCSFLVMFYTKRRYSGNNFLLNNLYNGSPFILKKMFCRKKLNLFQAHVLYVEMKEEAEPTVVKVRRGCKGCIVRQ